MFPNLLNNISFLKNNPGLSLVILILINSQPYCRKYILALIIITKLDEFYLIYQKLKMRQNGISRNVLNILTNSLKNRKKIVVLNRKYLSLFNTNAGLSLNLI